MTQIAEMVGRLDATRREKAARLRAFARARRRRRRGRLCCAECSASRRAHHPAAAVRRQSPVQPQRAAAPRWIRHRLQQLGRRRRWRRDARQRRLSRSAHPSTMKRSSPCSLISALAFVFCVPPFVTLALLRARRSAAVRRHRPRGAATPRGTTGATGDATGGSSAAPRAAPARGSTAATRNSATPSFRSTRDALAGHRDRRRHAPRTDQSDRDLDKPKPQVLIKVVFLEVTYNKGSDVGVEGKLHL